MFLDASAIIAMLAEEEEGPELALRLDEASQAYTSAIALYEATLGLVRRLRLPVPEAESILSEFLDRTGAQVVPVTSEIGRGALRAFERYGRGRHPAALNMGDCFAYACARALGVALLYKGDDFAQTDIVAG